MTSGFAPEYDKDSLDTNYRQALLGDWMSSVRCMLTLCPMAALAGGRLLYSVAVQPLLAPYTSDATPARDFLNDRYAANAGLAAPGTSVVAEAACLIAPSAV